jgi:NDP-sugar pyrophosphorylase family protein
MKVVILCGGLGTRLREETEFRPKPLVDVGGRPILWHIMKLYAHYGFREFLLCLGYRGNMIKEYFLNYEAMNNAVGGAAPQTNLISSTWRKRSTDGHRPARASDWEGSETCQPGGIGWPRFPWH